MYMRDEMLSFLKTIKADSYCEINNIIPIFQNNILQSKRDVLKNLSLIDVAVRGPRVDPSELQTWSAHLYLYISYGVRHDVIHVTVHFFVSV